MDIDIGIDKKSRQQIADGLSHLLADSYTLYLKTHNYHWNVTGPQFTMLHTMFEEHYTELALAVDDIAERIRAIGFTAPGSYKAFAKLTSIEEADDVPAAMDMVRDLVKAHEIVIHTGRAIIPETEKVNDEVTADLVTTRLQVHEKTAWMLRSLLD